MDKAHQASEHFFKGLKALNAGDLATAETRFQEALRLVPGRPSVLVNLSIVYAQSNRLGEALDLASAAVEQDGDPLFRLQKGVVLLQLGRYEDALSTFDEALDRQPDIAELHNNRASALRELGRFAEALAGYDKAIALKPDYAEAHGNRALALKELGRLDEALASADRAVALKPGRAEAHANRGNILFALGRLEEAVQSCNAAIGLNPGFAEAHGNRALVMKELGLLNEALASADRAVALSPRRAEAHASRGSMLYELSRLKEAVASFDTAIGLKPGYAEAHNNRGTALRALRKPEDALASYDQAIALRPDYAEAYANRANALKDLDRLEEALASCDHAVRLKPDHAEAFSIRGNVLRDMRRFEEALASHDTATGLKPRSADLHSNRGNALRDLNRPEEALAEYDEALRLEPRHAGAQFNKAMIVLQKGHLPEGFELLQSRWKTEEFSGRLPQTSVPLWRGEPFEGELLLWAEQGIGDEVFYASMLSLLEPGAARVTLAADKRLHAVYERSFPGLKLIDRKLTATKIEQPFDFQAPIGDLGHLLKVDAGRLAARNYPYLVPPPAGRGEILAAVQALGKQPVCGLAWKSSNRSIGEDKSIALADLEPVLNIPGVTFVNLQYGDVSSEIEAVAEASGTRVHQVPGLDLFDDIEGLLSLIDACDVVLTTSNVTAHLAGAIGKETAVLVPAARGRIWYWHDDTQSMWYPSLRLFSQKGIDDWPSSIGQAADWLRDHL